MAVLLALPCLCSGLKRKLWLCCSQAVLGEGGSGSN